MSDKYVPLSVREGNAWLKLRWSLLGLRETIALRLAPWLAPIQDRPMPGPTRYKLATLLWGDEPGLWPNWYCRCGQLHSGWALECGRCGADRVIR